MITLAFPTVEAMYRALRLDFDPFNHPGAHFGFSVRRDLAISRRVGR